MKLLIGRIPYLNSALFYYGLETNPETLANLEFIPMVPSRLSEAVLGRQIDAAPVPLVTTFDVVDDYEPLGDFCISTITKARSALFFSKKPIEMLNHTTIGITHETSTSARLLRVLFAQLYRVTPHQYVSIREPNHGFLLIGDAALRNRNGCDGYPFMTDLGEVWHDRTGLPFVFAVWMVRKSLPEEQKDYLKSVLDASLHEGWKHLDAAVGIKMKELHMTRAEVREYIDGFRYRMGPAEQDGIAKFSELDAMTRNLEAETRRSPIKVVGRMSAADSTEGTGAGEAAE
jgi:chorismate dehydratase